MKTFVLMNKKNGQIGLGIRVLYSDNTTSMEVNKLSGYCIRITPSKHDAWLINIGDDYWVKVSNEKIENNPLIEILGEL